MTALPSPLVETAVARLGAIGGGLPVVLVTLGDPAGIGPEVALAAALDAGIQAICRPVLVGPRGALEAALAVRAVAAEAVDESLLRPGGLRLIATDVDPGRMAWGAPTAAGGRASFRALELAAELMRRGAAPAVATAPISKTAWAMDGIHYPGHTEFFAEAFAAPAHVMAMHGERLTVVLATCHQSLASVPSSLTPERVASAGRLLHGFLRRVLGRAPRLVALGLNPHAGEGGLFGDEEAHAIVPALESLRAEGIDIAGPLPPDTAFIPANRARYEGFLAMYHDQGLIAFKLLEFADGVNVTLGLPRRLVRTSPDHGTAYDIAGRGVADPSSMMAAVRLAARLAEDTAK